MAAKNVVDIPLFDVGRIALFNDRKKMTRYLLSIGHDLDLSHSDGICVYETYQTNGVFVLGVFDNRPDTVAHEAFHVALRICSAVNVPVYLDASNETTASMIGFVVRAFYKAFPRHP